MSSDAHHILPLRVYFGVFAALLVMTAVTVAVSYMGLGEYAIWVALAVALVKAALVAGYFMHLKYDDRFLSVAFVSGLLFVVIFFVFVFIDLRSRGDVLDIQDNFPLQQDRATAGDKAFLPGTAHETAPAKEGAHH